jgi:trigger factor
VKVDYIEETAVRKALAFEIESEVVEREIDQKSRELARKARIPGFRPGKIPADVIKKRFRDQVLEDVAEAIVNRVVFQELEGRGLKPVAMPRVQDLKIAESQPMTFRAVFETLPLLEAPEWRGLRAGAKRSPVTDEAVEAELDALRDNAARFEPIEGRPAQQGDHAVLDLAWRPQDGGKGGRDENALIEVGSSENHPDFNAGILGMPVGDTREIRASYGTDHPSPALAGRSIVYRVTLKALKSKALPAKDDEFAKDLDFDSLQALRDDVRARLVAAEERRIDHELKQQLVDALVERAAFEVPESLVERHMTARTENAARGLALQGIDPSRIKMDWRGYRESQREEAVKAARADLLLDEIARRESVDVSEAELDLELSRLAARLRKSKPALRAQIEKEGDMAALRARLREGKVLDLIKANATLEVE